MKHLLACAALLFGHGANNPPVMLSQSIGDSRVHNIPLRWEKADFTPGNDYRLLFTAKRHANDLDPDAVFQKVTGAGITVTGSTAAVETVYLDTVNESPRTLIWDIQAEEIATGKCHTVANGLLDLRRDISRLAVSSIPIHTTNPPALLGAPGLTAYQVAVANGYDGTEEQWLTSLEPPALTSQAIADALQYTPAPYVPVLTRTAGEGSPNGYGTAVIVPGATIKDKSGNALTIPSIPINMMETNVDGIIRPYFSAGTSGDGLYCELYYLNNVTGWIVWVSMDGVEIAEFNTGPNDYSESLDSAKTFIPKSTESGYFTVRVESSVEGSLGQFCIVGGTKIYQCIDTDPVTWILAAPAKLSGFEFRQSVMDSIGNGTTIYAGLLPASAPPVLTRTVAEGAPIDGSTTGLLGQTCIVGESDVYQCVRASPVKWVLLTSYVP